MTDINEFNYLLECEGETGSLMPIEDFGPAPHLGYVYFIRTTEAIKIGYTKNTPSRFSNLQTSNPETLVFLGATRGTKEDERDLHQMFCHLQIRGEWFRVEEELLDYIKSALADDAWERSRPAPSRETLVLIKGLRKKRDACGADTPAGRRYSNLIEQVRNIEHATGEQVKLLQTFMARTTAEIERLTA